MDILYTTLVSRWQRQKKQIERKSLVWQVQKQNNTQYFAFSVAYRGFGILTQKG